MFLFSFKLISFCSINGINLDYRYRKMSPHLRQIIPSDIYQEKIRTISIYANDIHKALWYEVRTK